MDKPFSSAEEVASFAEERGLAKGFCHVPFASLILEPDGRVGSCRTKGTEFPVGNLNQNTIEEIWNGETIRAWRREFLSGKISTCKREQKHYQCNLCPEYNSILPRVEAKEWQTRMPRRVALNLNGHCNLECRMCHIWREPNGLYDLNGWWKQVEAFLADIEELELLSGEPFIQKDTYRLIDLQSQKNPACLWSITTNAQWRLNNKIRESLDKIRLKHLIISVDSLVPETYAKIRKNGKLSVVLQTINDLIDYNKSRLARGLGDLSIHLNFLVQKDNWKELGNFHEFAKEKGVRVFRIFCYEPLECSLLSLEQAERESVIQFYCEHLNREQLAHSRRVILPLLDSLPALERAYYLLELKNKIQRSAFPQESASANI